MVESDYEHDTTNIECESVAKDLNTGASNPECTDLSVGDFVAFNYDKKIYPGIITAMDETDVRVNAMQKTGKYWK